MYAILGSGIIGALAFTFSDSFWFSAVEGEVYAMSSLFTAVVFWAILRWEDEADGKHATRWILLIAFLMGLSIGVHLLNLLAIPAIAFIYYFKKYNPFEKRNHSYWYYFNCGDWTYHEWDYSLDCKAFELFRTHLCQFFWITI